MRKLIFHIDVNSAYLSWEAARRVANGEPDLRLIPSAIGGDRDKRTGVILAKSIPAKKYKITTGEPVAMALRKCPDLVMEEPEKGYRRLRDDLEVYHGIPVNDKRVLRICRKRGIKSTIKYADNGCTRQAKNPQYVAENLLNRNFHAEKPNEKWLTDVTEFSLFGEKLYLSPILDLCSGDLVSYTIFDRPTLSMVTSMLDRAFAIIPDGTGLILHSDQGWHYQHKKYQRMLEKKGIRQSMSRKGNCLDNAVMENFFGLLKSELLYLQDFDFLEHFKAELIDYLDYYNNRRIKLKLKGLTPAQHRCQTLQAA